MARRFTDFIEDAPELAGADAVTGDRIPVVTGGVTKYLDPAEIVDIPELAAALATVSPAAEDVTITDTGGYYTGTDVEAALQELGTAAVGGLAAHIADTSDAHDASAVSYNGGTGMSATDVEAAIDELATEKANSSEVLHLVAGGSSVENIGAVESNVNTVATSGSTETLDTSLYSVHDVTMDQNCTFTFSNPAPSGKATVFILILRGAFTPTWPAAVDWPSATPPTHTTPAVYTFITVDAGTTWLGVQGGKGFG